MKYKTSKLKKLENSRTESLLTDDMDHCYFCGKPKDDIHEIFQGKNRLNSIKYKLILPLCRYHHQELHNNQKLANQLKQQGQLYFEKNYDEDFLKIFYKNYL